MKETIVSFKGVFKKYGTNEVLRDVSFSLRRGEWHASGELGHVSHRDTEGTEAAGQACLEQRGIHKKYQYLLYILGRFHIIRLRPEQRARRGTASQFPAQRGGCGLLKRNTENPSFLKNLLCGNGCEAAIR